jgi:heme/copper-type cytochrome/quinol oxidase subunit 3
MSIALRGSSFTAMAARRAFVSGNIKKFYLWALATVGLGAFFATSQFLAECPELVHEGLTPRLPSSPCISTP